MQKELTIMLEEECLECPELSLTTGKLRSDNRCINIHTCCHSDFCRKVRKAWDVVRARKMVYCKECKWWNAEPCYDGCSRWSADPYEYPPTSGDDFCSYGERMSNDGKE